MEQPTNDAPPPTELDSAPSNNLQDPNQQPHVSNDVQPSAQANLAPNPNPTPIESQPQTPMQVDDPVHETEQPQPQPQPEMLPRPAVVEEEDDPVDCFLVYASNIPGHLTKEQFGQMVQPYAQEGTIKKVKLFNRVATDSSYGFVYFESMADGRRCIQALHRRVFDGHTMRWSHGDGSRGPMLSETNLYVEGLPSEWGDTDLRKQFETFGEITAARILVEKGSNKSREVGFVHFATHDQALAAMAGLNGEKAYEGAPRSFKIKFANRGRKQDRLPPPRAGPRYGEQCRYYARGHCKRGDACFYRHIAEGGMNDYPPHMPPNYDAYPPSYRGPPPGYGPPPGHAPYPQDYHRPRGDYPPPQQHYGAPEYPAPQYPPAGYGPSPRENGQPRWEPYEAAPRGPPPAAHPGYDYNHPPPAAPYGGYDYANGYAAAATPVQGGEWASYGHAGSFGRV